MIEAKKTFLLKFAYALQFLFYNVTWTFIWKFEAQVDDEFEFLHV